MTPLAVAYIDIDVFSSGDSEGIGAYSGLEISREAIRRNQEVNKLLGVLHRLTRYSSAAHETSVARQSLAFADALIRHLPINRILPKVAADEDGDILMFWDGQNRCALTIAGSHLLMVVNPGAKSEHIDPVTYSGTNIPPTILARIPTTITLT
jgi:hypothetical protein